VQDWLRGRADTSVGRLALQWFRGHFGASRNSGCVATAYSSLSILPAALVFVAYFHTSSNDANVFATDRQARQADRTTATLVQQTFGIASANALAATITVAITFLIGGIGIGQIYQDVYARAWGSRSGRWPIRGCSRSSSSSPPARSRSWSSPPPASATPAGSCSSRPG
jgi:hypothetical protein